jgi:uncharacterized protein YbjT (DUF2867 family)
MTMTRILVTGGTGTLGRELVPRLQTMGYTVRVMSRSPEKPIFRQPVEWAQAHLDTGKGLKEAVQGADMIIHAGGGGLTNTYKKDVLGTGRVVEAAAAAGVGHLIYISIVGIDRVPLPYYKHKLAAEGLIKAGSVSWTILRATQFHRLLDILIRFGMRVPLVAPLPTDVPFQPIDESEVAVRLVEAAGMKPSGYLEDIGGPEVRLFSDFLQSWMKAQGVHKRVVRSGLIFGKAAPYYRQGLHTTPEHRYGKITWEQWMERVYHPAGSTSSVARQTA